MMNGLKSDRMKLLESELYKQDLELAVKKINLSNLDGKSIFITGGLGLICSAVVDLLLTYGKTGLIYVAARNAEQFTARYGGINRVVFIKYDALDELNIIATPDYIIHGAGLASPELYTSKPVETILSNFDGVHSLLSFAKANHVKRVLYISSSEVYGKIRSEIPFEEGTYGEIDIDNIRSSYAIAKRASEMLCKSYCLEYGVDVVIARPGHIYGPSSKQNDKRVSSDFAFRAAFGDKIVMKSSGIQKRSYCYSIDCAVQILTILLKGECGQAYNIGHDEITTIRKMATIIAQAGNVKLEISDPTENDIKDFNPMNNSALNNDKIKKLGYVDTFTVEEGLTHTVKILKEITSR